MNVKELRKSVNMTQKDFSEYFGFSKRNIENWESGKVNCSPWIVELMEYKLKNEGILKSSK